jgi:hypothetical protein
MNRDIRLMCEVPVTVKEYKAECSLYDASSHFFPKNSSCSFLNYAYLTEKKWQGTLVIVNEKRSS